MPSRCNFSARALPTPRKAVIGRCSRGGVTALLAAASAKMQDAVDLDARLARQLRYSDSGTGGEWLRAVLRHHLVDLGEVRHVGQVHGDLHCSRERAPRSLCHRFEVFKHLAGFRLDIASY